jgi:hypothetical protein
MTMHSEDKIRTLFWKAAQASAQEKFTHILKKIEDIRPDMKFH